MPTQTSTTPAELCEKIYDSYEAYECRVNALPVAELFRRYEQGGFLYPAKKERLAPFLPEIAENWRRGLRGGEMILYVVSHENPASQTWGSISSWRTSHNGWNPQHLVSGGGAFLNIMLATQAIRIADGFDTAQQCWFQPKNAFASGVFGTIPKTVGKQWSAVNTYHYLMLPLRCDWAVTAKIDLVRLQDGRASDLHNLAAQLRGQVFAACEELNVADLELNAVDELYRRVGLRRYRRVWLAYHPAYAEPVGAAIAYRGPLGFNFSFLENRCDLLVLPDLTEEETAAVVSALVQAIKPEYQDFSPQFIPIVCDQQISHLLLAQGASLIRQYSQSMWLKAGYELWYRHIGLFHQRVEQMRQLEEKRQARRGAQALRSASLSPEPDSAQA